MKQEASFQIKVGRPIKACVGLAGLISALGLAVWILGLWRPGLLGHGGYIPMAPCSAILFILLSSASLAYYRRPSNRYSKISVFIAVVVALILSLSSMSQYFRGGGLSFERWLVPTPHYVYGFSSGRMSLLTDIAFLPLTLGLLFQLPGWNGRLVLRKAVSPLSLLSLILGLGVILGYAEGEPLIYTDQYFPMALPTAVCFVLMGVGQMLSAGNEAWPMSVFVSPVKRSSWTFSSAKNLIATLLILILGIGAGGYFYLQRQISASHKRIHDELTAIVNLKATQIANWRQERLGDAQLILENDFIQNEARLLLENPDNRQACENLKIWMQSLMRSYDYRSMAILGYDGAAQLREPEGFELLSKTDKLAFNEAVRTGEIYVQDLHLVESSQNEVRINLWVPIRSRSWPYASPIGVWVMQIDPQRFLYPQIQSWPTKSDSAETVLVRLEGERVLFLNELRHHSNSAMTFTLPLSQPQLIAAAAVSGREGIMEGLDYRGVRVLAAIKKVEGTPWRLLTKVDRMELDAPLRRQIMTTYATQLVLVLAFVTGMGLIQRQRDAKRLGKILDSTPFPIALVDIDDNHIQFWSHGALDLFGHTAPTTRQWHQIAYPDPAYREEVIRRLKPFLEVAKNTDRAVNAGEYCVTCRDGSVRACELHAAFIADSLVVTFNDITHRKEAENKLLASEAFIRSLFDHLPQIIFLKDLESRYIACNSISARVLGKTVEEIVGKTDFDFQTRDLAEKFRESDRKVISSGKPLEIEEPYAIKGVMKYAHTIKVPYHDEKGKIIGVLCILEDITERKKSEREHEKLQAQLAQAQKMESVGRLAGGVAHDFNNMLTVILGHVTLALKSIDPSSPIHDDLLQIQKSAERSADLTRQLLGFARKQPIVPRVIDLNETIGGMLQMLKRMIGETIDLTFLPSPEPARIKIDPSQINQILANLCVNARDAIASHGRITIQAELAHLSGNNPETKTEVAPGKYIRLTVSDDGCGMTKETVARLFEPFFTTKEVGKGTGLGLAMVYGIIKQNNGIIGVETEPGKGSTFVIYLRQYDGQVEIHDSGAAASLPRGHETILLVEDEPAILKLIKTVIAGEGYEVLAADSPNLAIRLAQESEKPIDLLLTDVVMPEMNGQELAKCIKAIHPGMKSIYMSGYTADTIPREDVEDQEFNFISKPLSIDTLTAKLREVLDREPTQNL